LGREETVGVGEMVVVAIFSMSKVIPLVQIVSLFVAVSGDEQLYI
jgi:hypothetical protein